MKPVRECAVITGEPTTCISFREHEGNSWRRHCWTGTQGKPPLQQTNDDLDNCAISTIVRGWEALERSAGKDAAPIALFEHHHR